MLFSAFPSFAQSLSLNDLLRLDTSSAKSAIPFLESKGYRLKDTWSGSKNLQVSYFFVLESDIKDTSLYSGSLSLYRSDNKEQRYLTFLSYETPDINVFNALKQSLAEQKFKLPKKKNKDPQHRYYETNDFVSEFPRSSIGTGCITMPK